MPAMELVAQVERESRLLRSVVKPGSRHYRVHGRFVVAEGQGQPPNLPIALPDETAPRDDRLQASADFVRVGKGEDILRARAFYLDAGMTLVIHGRLVVPWPRPAVLHRGATVAERVRPVSPFVVPRQLERGRGPRHAWLLEELVHGDGISRDEWPVHAPSVLEGLARMWTAAGVERVLVEMVLPARRRRSALQIVHSMSDLGIDEQALVDAVDRLTSTGGSVLAGWCHGDPMRANVLRVQGDRFALLDWEAAGHRPLGWDASKTIMELEDPLPAADSIAATMHSAGGHGVLPWREQLALGCLIRLARSRLRHVRAAASGNREYQQHVRDSRRRNALLLARLLGAAS